MTKPLKDFLEEIIAKREKTHPGFRKLAKQYSDHYKEQGKLAKQVLKKNPKKRIKK